MIDSNTLALTSISGTDHLQQLGLGQMEKVFQQQSHYVAAWVTVQRLQGLLRRFHEVPSGGRRRTFGEAQESHLQSGALREYRRVDSGEWRNGKCGESLGRIKAQTISHSFHQSASYYLRSAKSHPKDVWRGF